MKKLEQEKQKLVKEVDEVQTKLNVALTSIEYEKKVNEMGHRLTVSLQILRGKTHKQSKKFKKGNKEILPEAKRY